MALGCFCTALQAVALLFGVLIFIPSVQVRRQDGEHYTRQSLKVIIAGIQRTLRLAVRAAMAEDDLALWANHDLLNDPQFEAFRQAYDQQLRM